ncbi:hypothetical protein LCGC14_1292510 [marine sediment metagenome]|uniref:Uncharacterized protein n=1 Tax=marine sediment metagenome TaxID=412755 RepID=A0A0F9KS74_9ZZZZ
MSNKYKILELLKGNELTVKEIADKTEFNENEVRVYTNRLMKDNLIKKIGKKNRYVLYTAIDKELSDNKEFETLRKGYNQLNTLFESLTKNAKVLLKNNQLNSFKQLIQETIDINLIKHINSEMIN